MVSSCGKYHKEHESRVWVGEDWCLSTGGQGRLAVKDIKEYFTSGGQKMPNACSSLWKDGVHREISRTRGQNELEVLGE